MKITLLTGSPKGSNSTSHRLLDCMADRLGRQHQISRIVVKQTKLTTEQADTIHGCEILVIAFPLYIDAIPSHLFQVLIDLETQLKDRPITVYGIVNCGFYEGEQTRHALAILENWCAKAGLKWGCGIGCGGGEGIAFAGTEVGKGPLTSLGENIDALVGSIVSKSSGENLYSSMNYPRVLYQVAARYIKWYPLMKKNGVRRRNAKGKGIH